ncbi:MAG: histidinol-phosphatase HisJ family protein [Syntrophomonadaceae bacterium]|nr:histidinol-phosphatase HisJ family protein [Syntrophomonadaceae bacterium]
MVLIDYHVHVVGHGEYKFNRQRLQAYIQQARETNLSEIGLLEHDEYWQQIDFDLIKHIQQDNPDINIRCGLEMDYFPGQEKTMHSIISSAPWDYLIGSVHFIDGWGFDHPDYKDEFECSEIDSLYDQYYNLIVQTVDSGLFDIIGHLDLIKIWGHNPIKKAACAYAEPVLKKIKASGVVVEINSAGLRKPVKEIYPSQEIMEQMFRLNIPVTLGSDAHNPEQVGDELEKCVELLKKIGYRSMICFERRKHRVIPLDL